MYQFTQCHINHKNKNLFTFVFQGYAYFDLNKDRRGSYLYWAQNS